MQVRLKLPRQHQIEEVKIVENEPVEKVKTCGASIVGYERPGLNQKTHSRRVPMNPTLLYVVSSQDFEPCRLKAKRVLM